MRSHIYHCVTCRKLRGKLREKKMVDLPEERSSDAAPFRYVGMDIFVPFVTEASRKKLKRYGAMVMHLEVVDSMETDSFIMC